MTILLVDDDAFEMQLLCAQLKQLGHTEVICCEYAGHALALLEAPESPIGLVICDLQMPDIDGVEFVRHLARIEYSGSLVLLSGEDARILQTAHTLALAHGVRIIGAEAKPLSLERLQWLLAGHAAHPVGALFSCEHTPTPQELADAIKGGELVNHYQPKVDLGTGAVIGVETLVRWRHPSAGLLYPDQFIATAEEHGLIDALTEAVLVAALQQARLWRNAGHQLHVAVNVSMDNLTTLQFPDAVERLAVRAGVPVRDLVLEVTESRLMQDTRAPLDVLTRLRLKRIGLSIDDFGTGHSSLAQLRDIPFDELKLDRGFVTNAFGNPALRAIVEGTLEMTRQLGIRSVAEGVETRDDWDFVRKLGCNVAQGYFVARPMPAEAVAGWLGEWALRWPGLGRLALA